MVRMLVGVIVLLVVVAGGLGFLFFSGAISTAQPTTTAATVPTPTPRPTTATGAQPPAATGGAQQQGGAAAAAPEKPVITKQVTYGDWIYVCLKQTADAAAVCSISQTLSDAKTKSPLFLWRIVSTDKGLVAEWQTRTGIMVDRGLLLDTGGDKPIGIPFQFCTPTGCQAQANLAADFIDVLNKAQKATATVFPIGSNPVLLTLSVKGLPDALAALKSPS